MGTQDIITTIIINEKARADLSVSPIDLKKGFKECDLFVNLV